MTARWDPFEEYRRNRPARERPPRLPDLNAIRELAELPGRTDLVVCTPDFVEDVDGAPCAVGEERQPVVLAVPFWVWLLWSLPCVTAGVVGFFVTWHKRHPWAAIRLVLRDKAEPAVSVWRPVP